MDEIQKPNNLTKTLLHTSSFQNYSCWNLCTLSWTLLVYNEVLLHSRPDNCKSKGIPRQAEVAQGVSGRLRPRIFSTFSTTRVVGRQPNAPAAFSPGEIPGTHFQRLSRPQGTWFCCKEPRKKSPVTPPGIDPGTVRLVAQRLNHYATPGPDLTTVPYYFFSRCFFQL